MHTEKMRNSLPKAKLSTWIHNAPIDSKVQQPSPPGNPPGIWTFQDCLVQIPSPRGKKAFQMPHQLVVNYVSSKANFFFNQHFSKRDMP